MAAAESRIHVEVIYSPKVGDVRQVALTLPAGSTVADAVEKSGLPQEFDQLRPGNAISVGVWGKLRELGDTLIDRDRVEVYRPLLVDPKEARRQRHRSHRAKGAAALGSSRR